MFEHQEWFNNPDIRPYVLVRKANIPFNPASFHEFKFKDPLIMDPFFVKEAAFANQILKLENLCFKASGMTLPRWVFYDCSLMPGLVVGFAHKTKTLPASIRKIVPIDESLEYTPISLFIAIPTNELGHWVAHNLCSVSSILPAEDRFSYLGFLTKAFGLWYFNIQKLYGMAQWGGNAIKVHANYGDLQVISSYTEIHDYPQTLTYLVDIRSYRWQEYLDEKIDGYVRPATKYQIDPKDQDSMRAVQTALEKGEGPFFLNGKDFLRSPAPDKIQIYL